MYRYMYYYLFDNYTSNEIMWFSLYVLLIAELPVLFFSILDYLKLKSLEKYRISYDEKRIYPLNNDLKIAFIEHFSNLTMVIFPLAIFGLMCNYIFDIYPYDMSRNMPNIFVCIFHICSILFMTDILFYIFHRIMHLPYYYKKYHKYHHMYTETFALVNHCLHPTELILFFLPVMIPPILLKSHIMLMWFCAIITNWNGIIIHSGYRIPKKKFPYILEHDIHHKYFNYNYGSMFIFMDKLCGTYKTIN